MLRRSERELREANAMLHQLSTVRRDFLQIAVHDVRAPIGGVVMMLNNLNNGLCGRLDDQQTRLITRCLKRLDGLSELLGDLRALSYLETSDIDAQKTCVDLRELLADLVEEHRGLAGDHQHELIAEIPERLPGVMGVERLLREAVANYITNAIKYTPDGGRIVVRARSADHVVRIEVQDNGIGIAPKDQRRLFEEFVRVKVAGTTVSNVTGSGLGLSIVRNVVEKHGGLVGVRSRPKKGSTFFIHLPAADAVAGGNPGRAVSTSS
jgi:signal transduction histidine kinase